MGSVSVVLPYDDRWYFAEIRRGAVETIEAAGHTAVVHVIPPGSDTTSLAADAVERDFAAPDSLGAVAAGFRYRADQRDRSLAWQRPIVVVGGSVTGFPTVLIDDIGAAWAAVDHLQQLGHTRIAHLAGTLHDQMDFSVHGRRAKGYRLAMERAGLPLEIVEADFGQEAAAAAARALLDRPDRPTAVFTVNDEMAFPLLDTARALGLTIGKDLSVVGFDDHPRAEEEDLTTVRQRPAELGATAAELLLSGIGHGPDPKRSRLAQTALIQRGSSRRLR